MEQFLPSDVSVMVLRYLAGRGAASSVFAMLEEMPLLKFIVPGQSPGLSKSDYIRTLGRNSSFTPGLEDVLDDYVRAKTIVSEIAQKQEPSNSPIQSCDSLGTQLKQLSAKIDKLKSEQLQNTQHSEVTPILNPKIVIEVGTCTEQSSISKVDKEIQTDELPTEFEEVGENRDLQTIYNTLISDNSLLQKLASISNEGLMGPKISNNDGVQNACSKVETELNLDKFLSDLLKEGPDEDSIDLIPTTLLSPGRNHLPSVINEGDSGLSNLFQDAHSLITKDINLGSSDNVLPTINLDHMQSLFKSKETEINTIFTSPNQNSNVDDMEVSSSNDTIDSSLNSKAVIFQTPKSAIPKKRIVPKPAPTSTIKINPVFETVQERNTSDTGHYYSVNKIVPLIPLWQKLGRRTIEPRIPKSPPLESVKIDLNQSSAKINPKGNKTFTVEPERVVVIPGSSNKRKAKVSTPIKMTPEKASDSDLNFFLVYHDTQKPGQINQPSALEDGECPDSNSPIKASPPKSYNNKLLTELFGPMTPDKVEQEKRKYKDKRNLSKLQEEKPNKGTRRKSREISSKKDDFSKRKDLSPSRKKHKSSETNNQSKKEKELKSTRNTRNCYLVK